MSDPMNEQVTSLASPTAMRCLTLSAQLCSDERCVHTPKASPPMIATLMSLAVTFLITTAITNISATRATATAIAMFFADSRVSAVMSEPYVVG